MASPVVAVAFDAKPEIRAVFEETLGGRADLRFIGGADAETRRAVIDAASVVVTHFLNRDLDREAGELDRLSGKLVHSMIAGVDSMPFDLLPEGALLAHNGGGYAPQMAEHVVAMILAARKELFDRHAALQRGYWKQFEAPTRAVQGSTCLIAGFGGIGKATANLLRPFGVRIEAMNRSGKTDEPVDAIGTMADFDAMLPRADIVVLSAGLNAETRGMINARTLGLMKPDAVLVNVARGAVIDEADLYAHLQANPEFWACLDTWWGEPFSERKFVTAFPFLELPNVIGSPHNSALAAGFLLGAARHACANVAKYLETGQADRLATAADRA